VAGETKLCSLSQKLLAIRSGLNIILPLKQCMGRRLAYSTVSHFVVDREALRPIITWSWVVGDHLRPTGNISAVDIDCACVGAREARCKKMADGNIPQHGYPAVIRDIISQKKITPREWHWCEVYATTRLWPQAVTFSRHVSCIKIPWDVFNCLGLGSVTARYMTCWLFLENLVSSHSYLAQSHAVCRIEGLHAWTR